MLSLLVLWLHGYGLECALYSESCWSNAVCQLRLRSAHHLQMPECQPLTTSLPDCHERTC